MASKLPVMRSDRARDVLGWEPVHSSTDAIHALVSGLKEGAGAPTPPLDPRTSGPLRAREFLTGIGQRP